MSTGTGGGTGTGTAGGQPPDYTYVAAREATGAHRDTGAILKLLLEGGEETDPIAVLIDGQDAGLDRQTRALDLLRTLLDEVRAMAAEQRRQAGEIATLRKQSDVVSAKLTALAFVRP